jgi:hypothetical protein
MCKIEKCDRTEFDFGLCLDHLKEKVFGVKTKAKPRKSRKTKVDAVEVVTADDTTNLEVRESAEAE